MEEIAKRMVWEYASCVVEGMEGMDKASHWLMNEWDDSYTNYMELLVSSPQQYLTTMTSRTAVASYMLVCTMLHRKLQQPHSNTSKSATPPPMDLLSCLSQTLHHYSTTATTNNNNNEEEVILPLCYCYASTWVYHYLYSSNDNNKQKNEEYLLGIASNHLPSLTILLRVWQCIPHELDVQITTKLLTHNSKEQSSSTYYYSTLIPFTLRLITHALQQQSQKQQTNACRTLSHWSNHISYHQLYYHDSSSPGVLHQLLISLLSSSTTLNPQSSSTLGCPYYIATIFTDIISNIYQSSSSSEVNHNNNGSVTSIDLLLRECQALFPTFQQVFLNLHLHPSNTNNDELTKYSLANACIAILTTEEVVLIDNIYNKMEWWEFAIRNLQMHTQTNIAIDTMDIWLTLQDIPNEDRPSFLQSSTFLPHVLHALIQRLTPSPHHNNNHYDDDDDDDDDYNELKSMSVDVFITLLYGLSIPKYLDIICCGYNSSNNNNDTSVASFNNISLLGTRIFSLNCVATQLLSSHSNDSIQFISNKLQSTILPQILSTTPPNTNTNNSQSLNATATTVSTSCYINCIQFLGIYTSLWKNPPSSSEIPPFQNILTYLTQILTHTTTTTTNNNNNSSDFHKLRMEIAKAIKKFCICSTSHSNNIHLSIDPNMMQAWVQSCLQPQLPSPTNSDDGDSWQVVAETILQACIRYIIFSNHKEWYQTIILNPLWQYTTTPQTPTTSTVQPKQSSSVTYGKLWEQVIISTTHDTDNSNYNNDMMETMLLPIVWQLLSSYTLPSTAINNNDEKEFLSIWITLHIKLLSHIPFEQAQEITNLILSSYIQTYEPCLLKYFSSVVEHYGSLDQQKDMFPPLWTYLMTHTCTHLITSSPSSNDNSELVEKFFYMAKRFWTFCPNVATAMVTNSMYNDLWVCIMTCLPNVENDWDATRAVIQFISILLPQYYPSSDEYGYTLMNACIAALTTGQCVSMLVPAYTDCLFALVLNNTQKSQEWVHRVLVSSSSNDTDNTKVQTVVRPVMELLFPMITKDGYASKPRAKMLINDMSKIFNGESTMDSLLTYSL